MLRNRAAALLAHEGELASSRAELLWGGGHVLQFVYAALMLTNWSILARLSLAKRRSTHGSFRISLALVALLAIAAPAF